MTRPIRNFVLLLAVLGLTVTAFGQDAPPAIPATPAPVLDVVSIQPFDLETPSSHLWRAEKPTVRTGYVLVLRVDPALVFPRQTAEPVLYVGNQTAERINVGHESGHVVAIVPAVTDPERADYLDLTQALMWFGSPELPERVTAKRIEQERQAAIAAGITPFAQAKVVNARQRGGAMNEQASKRTLYRDAMRRLVRTYSPQERELVDGVLLEDR